MSDSASPFDFGSSRKAAKRLRNAAEQLTDALKGADKSLVKLPQGASDAVLALTQARKALKALGPAMAALGELDPSLGAALRQAERAGEANKARVLAALDDALRPTGHRLEGRPPSLRCGPLTLEVSGTHLRIWYGPKLEKLGETPLDPEKATRALLAILEELEGEPLNDMTFLVALQSAWRAAVGRAGGAPGDRAAVTSVLGEMAIGRQSKSWRLDPSRASFKPYGRIRFAHDLSRLKTRRIGDAELVLTVATRDQTKTPADHLWVGGTHFAWIAFRE